MAKINTKLLINFMKENNMSQKEFAKFCNISLYCTRKLLSGACNINIQTLFNVCLSTKLSSDDILCRIKKEG